jgi:hypothetical protein
LEEHSENWIEYSFSFPNILFWKNPQAQKTQHTILNTNMPSPIFSKYLCFATVDFYVSVKPSEGNLQAS